MQRGLRGLVFPFALLLVFVCGLGACARSHDDPEPLGQAVQALTYASCPSCNAIDLGGGKLKYTVRLPSGQKYVEIFVRKNGVQHVAQNITSSASGNGDGTSTYSLTVSGYAINDRIDYRFYSYLPSSPGVFTPGPQEQVWVSYTYGTVFDAPCSKCSATAVGTSTYRFAVTLPTGQKYVELFVRKNGVQLVAQDITASAVDRGDGTNTYSLVVGGYVNGDRIDYRFYSYLPSSPGVFTPGPREQMWATVCAVFDQCRTPVFDPATGTCSTPNKPDGSACNDGNPCTENDQCQAGACIAGAPVVCPAAAECHEAGICNPATGTCGYAVQRDNTACGTAGSCLSGACVRSRDASGLGAPTSVAPDNGHLDVGVTGTATLAEVAQAYFQKFGRIHGLSGGAADVLVTSSVSEVGYGRVRVQQVVGTLPLFGAEAMVHINEEDRTVHRVAGRLIPTPSVNTTLTLSAEQAIVAAASPPRSYPVQPAHAMLGIYSPTIVRRAAGNPSLAYKVEAWNWVTYVDAATGAVLYQYDTEPSYWPKERSVYFTNVRNVFPGAAWKIQEGEECVHDTPYADQCAAFDYMGVSWDYLMNLDYQIGRWWRTDIYRTVPLVATIPYPDDSVFQPFIEGDRNCPNAMQIPIEDWKGQFLFCAGWAQAKDIVAHELTHLITNSTARLEYHDQPGALNESYSDIIASLVDGNWVIGEDYPHNDVKDIRRYLDDPHSSPAGWRPDSIGEYLDVNADNGGVHYNSGIWNRVAVLIADGGTFHSGTVTGIGRQKLALISYTTLTTRLVATSGFYEAADETLAACYDLSKYLPSMMTDADCLNTVSLALVSAGLLPH